MRNVEHHIGNRETQHVENRIEGLGAEIIDSVQRGRRREQAQVIGAFRQQAIDESGVDAIRREYGIGDALGRVLIVVEPGRAERQVEIGNDRIEMHIFGDGPGNVVRHRRSADAAFGADHGQDLADRLGVRGVEQDADRPDHVDGGERGDQIFTDAAADQVAIEQHVIVPSDDDDARAGIADVGEFVEARQDALAVRSSAAAWTIDAVSTVSQNACTDTRGAGAMNSSAPEVAPCSGLPDLS